MDVSVLVGLKVKILFVWVLVDLMVIVEYLVKQLVAL